MLVLHFWGDKCWRRQCKLLKEHRACTPLLSLCCLYACSKASYNPHYAFCQGSYVCALLALLLDQEQGLFQSDLFSALDIEEKQLLPQGAADIVKIFTWLGCGWSLSLLQNIISRSWRPTFNRTMLFSSGMDTSGYRGICIHMKTLVCHAVLWAYIHFRLLAYSL